MSLFLLPSLFSSLFSFSALSSSLFPPFLSLPLSFREHMQRICESSPAVDILDIFVFAHESADTIHFFFPRGRRGARVSADQKGRNQKSGIDIVIRHVGRPTYARGTIYLPRWKRLARRVRGVYRRQNIRGGPTEFAAGRNFIYTYSASPDPPSAAFRFTSSLVLLLSLSSSLSPFLFLFLFLFVFLLALCQIDKSKHDGGRFVT